MKGNKSGEISKKKPDRARLSAFFIGRKMLEWLP